MLDELRKFGPRPKGALELDCAACRKKFKPGDYTTLIALGPGDDPEGQKRCREGRPYNAIAIEVHYSCATGITEEQK